MILFQVQSACAQAPTGDAQHGRGLFSGGKRCGAHPVSLPVGTRAAPPGTHTSGYGTVKPNPFQASHFPAYNQASRVRLPLFDRVLAPSGPVELSEGAMVVKGLSISLAH